MALIWRLTDNEKPKDGQHCLTKMKHGMIEGTYDETDDSFYGYYWHDMTLWASTWVPI